MSSIKPVMLQTRTQTKATTMRAMPATKPARVQVLRATMPTKVHVMPPRKPSAMRLRMMVQAMPALKQKQALLGNHPKTAQAMLARKPKKMRAQPAMPAMKPTNKHAMPTARPMKRQASPAMTLMSAQARLPTSLPMVEAMPRSLQVMPAVRLTSMRRPSTARAAVLSAKTMWMPLLHRVKWTGLLGVRIQPRIAMLGPVAIRLLARALW
mmetsp:Transcript_17079/g.45644  ORF Transcript_17079/g.45644 Transcript_17079/m.45644 type:complete len:210 (+) Transcript_17079:169-798(+)